MACERCTEARPQFLWSLSIQDPQILSGSLGTMLLSLLCPIQVFPSSPRLTPQGSRPEALYKASQGVRVLRNL